MMKEKQEMNPNEIKKALECLCGQVIFCRECKYSGHIYYPEYRQQMAKDTLAYINQLEAEVERLNTENRILSQKRFNIFERLKFTNKIRDKAIKEFAEKSNRVIDNLLKTYSVLEKYSVTDFDEFKAIRQVLRGLRNDIYNIEKEMMGES